MAAGGTGKTQLAVEFAHAMWNGRLVEVLVWVTATNAESVLTGFAQAANMIDAGPAGESTEAAAARFVAWLAHTKRPWALIIDDLSDLADMAHLWPSGASGRTLITTRLPAESFEAMDIRVVPVPGLSRREALSYLTSRLTDHPDQRIEALDLAEDLAGLSLALSQAIPVINARQQSCREYRATLGERPQVHVRGGRSVGHPAGHLVAGRRVRARAAAGRAGLAHAGAGRHDGPPRDPRRRHD